MGWGIGYASNDQQHCSRHTPCAVSGAIARRRRHRACACYIGNVTRRVPATLGRRMRTARPLVPDGTPIAKLSVVPVNEGNCSMRTPYAGSIAIDRRRRHRACACYIGNVTRRVPATLDQNDEWGGQTGSRQDAKAQRFFREFIEGNRGNREPILITKGQEKESTKEERAEYAVRSAQEADGVCIVMLKHNLRDCRERSPCRSAEDGMPRRAFPTAVWHPILRWPWRPNPARSRAPGGASGAPRAAGPGRRA
jgi:hypothetical protein